MSGNLEELWREHAGREWDGPGELDERVRVLEAAAAQAWGFAAPPLSFARTLASAWGHAVRKSESAELDNLATNDLFLAAGALAGDAAAVAAFREAVGPDLDRVVRRLVPDAERSDVRQRLEARLLVGSAEKPPALTQYRGSGSLHAWVRAVATRALIDEQRARARAPGVTEWVSRPDVQPTGDFDVRVALGKHAASVRSALERAFEQLSARQRNLIRYSLFHGLGIDELAALYGVHRATAARWLQRARADLSERLEEGFANHLGAPADDAASLLRQLRSRIDVSIRSFLASTLEAEADTER